MDLVRHGRALNYFGIPLSSVLVSIAASGNAGLAIEESGDGDGVLVGRGGRVMVGATSSLQLPEVHVPLRILCEHCGAGDKPLSVCPVCLLPGTGYCSRKCRKGDAERHRRACKDRVALNRKAERSAELASLADEVGDAELEDFSYICSRDWS